MKNWYDYYQLYLESSDIPRKKHRTDDKGIAYTKAAAAMIETAKEDYAQGKHLYLIHHPAPLYNASYGVAPTFVPTEGNIARVVTILKPDGSFIQGEEDCAAYIESLDL